MGRYFPERGRVIFCSELHSRHLFNDNVKMCRLRASSTRLLFKQREATATLHEIGAESKTRYVVFPEDLDQFDRKLFDRTVDTIPN
ncbi:MAG: hypothetical protein SGPRY_009048 [Prymnesium sp.]